jgi:hypothetical protein
MLTHIQIPCSFSENDTLIVGLGDSMGVEKISTDIAILFDL